MCHYCLHNDGTLLGWHNQLSQLSVINPDTQYQKYYKRKSKQNYTKIMIIKRSCSKISKKMVENHFTTWKLTDEATKTNIANKNMVKLVLQREKIAT